MSDDEEMKSLGEISNIVEDVQNSHFINYHRLKAYQKLRDKERAEVEKLKQECCQLRAAKSVSNNKVKESELNKIRLLNFNEMSKAMDIQLENKLMLLEKENELMEKRIANDSIKYDNQWNEIEKKLESLPHYREIKRKLTEIEQLKDSLNNLELKAVTLREENSKKKAQTWKTDRDYIIKLAEFMVARKKKYEEETVVRNKRISYNDSLIFKTPTEFREAKFAQYKSETVNKNKLVMPATPYKFQENVKKVLKDCTEVDVKDVIDKITADFDSKKKKQLEIFEENKSETASSYDNTLKRKRTKCLNGPYDNDKQINEGSLPKKQDCSKKQVIEIIEDVIIDKKYTYSLLSEVNVNELKETNKLTGKVQANTFPADAKKGNATKDEENVAQEENGGNINEISGDSANSVVNKETVVIPEQDDQEENHGLDADFVNNWMDVISYNGEDLELPKIDLLLSPKADLESVMDED